MPRLEGEARILDAVLGKNLEKWSFDRIFSATEDAPQAAHSEKVLDEDIPHHSIRKASLAFQSDELSDILTASAAAPTPLFSEFTLNQRFNIRRPPPPSHKPVDEECATSARLSPAASCVRADTCYRQQSMPMRVKMQGCFEGLFLFVGEADILEIHELHDSSFLLWF
eukprot:CAMPEP_0180338130 /NCGR_PEP_ID=MMETSP0988-20121125/45755_1 /TAXON_ID=697907 /ORGANISM="non described non described, Strain CCMP2293" /LENGTH=167 /DNA_ID=CAMNT_0022326529 /DNA_START=72 /DNA_END=575 /DNA_ORIENTATION=-